MRQKTTLWLVLSVTFAILYGSSIAMAIPEDETEIEISSISAGFGAVIVEIKNSGTESAYEISSTTTVKGGILNSIDLIHVCEGCDVCGTSLAAGAIKSESTREAGFLFGFGSITITVSAQASNAEQVTATAQGTIIGPFVMIN